MRLLVSCLLLLLSIGILRADQTLQFSNIGAIVIQPTSDIGAAINAAVITNGPGRYILPPGNYTSSTTINPSAQVALECAGVGDFQFLNNTKGTCLIRVVAGKDGFTCGPAAQRSSIRGIQFYSLNTGADTHNGINISCAYFHAEDVAVQRFGQDGFHFDSGPGNADFWSLTNTTTYGNFRDGYFYTGVDVNAGVCLNCSSFVNGRYGLNTAVGGVSNIFIGFTETSDVAGGYNLGSFSEYLQPYCEASATMTVVGTGNTILAGQFGACAITETSINTNRIVSYKGGFLANNELNVGPTPGFATPYIFSFRSGFVGAPFFEIVDQTAAIDAMLYNSVDRSWTLPASIKAGAFTTTNMLISSTAPTITSGFGATAPSIAANNGPSAFRVNVGTGTVANTGVIGLPAATTGWNCFAQDATTFSTSVFMTRMTASSTSSVTLGNFTSAGAAGPWIASDVLEVSCFAY